MEGHFLLTSGLHSPVYWEKFRIIENPAYTTKLCAMIAEHFKSQGVELVVGPTTGGIILAFEVARQMGLQAAFAEKLESGERDFRRGFNIKPGERVLIVDDILTTGKSVREVIAAVNKAGGEVAGIAVMVDRSQAAMDFGAPLFSCLHSVTPAYHSAECPLCKSCLPLVKPGGN